jgi:hypothetical protein
MEPLDLMVRTPSTNKDKREGKKTYENDDF